MQKLIPVLLVIVSITVLWGAITNTNPWSALRRLASGKDPKGASPIMDGGDSTELPSESAVPNAARGKDVTGIFVVDKPGGKIRDWYPVINFANDQHVYLGKNAALLSTRILSGPKIKVPDKNQTNNDQPGYSGTIATGQIVPLSELE